MKPYKLERGLNECTNEEYHSDVEYLSSTGLKTLLKDSEKFYKEKILGEYEYQQKNVFDEGSYAHTLILEPEQADKEYAFFPGWRKAGKEWKEFQEDKANKGKVMLSKPQKVRVERWVASYRERPEAVSLIQGGFSEQTVATEIAGVPVKVRADYINPEKGYIADVKTTSFPADVDSFRYTVEQYSYELSAALYCMAFEQHYGKELDFYFIVLGKKENDCHVYKLSDRMKGKGKSMMMEALDIYKKCKATGDWTINGKHAIISEDTESIYEILSI